MTHVTCRLKLHRRRHHQHQCQRWSDYDIHRHDGAPVFRSDSQRQIETVASASDPAPRRQASGEYVASNVDEISSVNPVKSSAVSHSERRVDPGHYSSAARRNETPADRFSNSARPQAELHPY